MIGKRIQCVGNSIADAGRETPAAVTAPAERNVPLELLACNREKWTRSLLGANDALLEYRGCHAGQNKSCGNTTPFRAAAIQQTSYNSTDVAMLRGWQYEAEQAQAAATAVSYEASDGNAP